MHDVKQMIVIFQLPDITPYIFLTYYLSKILNEMSISLRTLNPKCLQGEISLNFRLISRKMYNSFVLKYNNLLITKTLNTNTHPKWL